MCITQFLIYKKCNYQCFQFLEPPASGFGAFGNLQNDSRRAIKLVFSTREKFMNYFTTSH